MKLATSALAPSIAALPNEMRKAQAGQPLYNGRPDNLRGPPIAIYHKVFAELREDLANLNAIHVSADELKTTHELFALSAAFYGLEKERVKETKSQWERLLGETISAHELDDGSARADGSVMVEVELGLRALLAVFEWKLELGSVGDAGYQGACTFRKFVSQNTVRFFYRPVNSISQYPVANQTSFEDVQSLFDHRRYGPLLLRHGGRFRRRPDRGTVHGMDFPWRRS